MGFKTQLNNLFSFVYKARLDNGLTEHEYDHVLLGKYNKDPLINELEVCDWKWVDLDALSNDLVINPKSYTVWFKIIFEKFYKNIN